MNPSPDTPAFSGPIDPGVLAAAIEHVFTSTPTGQEMRRESIRVEDETVTVIFKGSEGDTGGLFGAHLPAPAFVGDEAWEYYPDALDLEEWATYGVLVRIVEEYDTGRHEGRGVRIGGILWLDA